MNRQRNQLVKATLITVFVIGGLSSAASAARNNGGHGNHRHSSTCGCQIAPQYAGKITIDGYTSSIRSDRPMQRQIAGAFRKAGYDARVSNGRVVVDYSYCQPVVRWSTDRYRARFRWNYSYGELSITLDKNARSRDWRPNRRRPVSVSRRSIGWGYCN